MINNFILIHYCRDISKRAPISIKKEFIERWSDLQHVLLNRQIKRIRNLYPNAKIHILTNEKINFDSKVFIHCKNFNSDHTSKFLLFGLIDEPSIYLDSDLILIDRFPQQKFKFDEPFNLFRSRFNPILSNISSKKLPFSLDRHYNGCLILINKPNEKISLDLKKIHDDYFNDEKLILENKMWPGNDEYAISFYIKENNIKSFELEGLAMPRELIKNPIDFKKYQSIHFGGLENKNKYIEEYNQYISPLTLRFFM